MDKKYYKPKYLRNILITILIIALVSTLSYFLVIRTVNYNLGEDYYLARLYPDAIKKLEPLGDFKDSKSLYIRSLYKQAEIYYVSYDYLNAIDYYTQLAQILPDTSILIQDSMYMMAILEGLNERYDECVLLLNKIEDYKSYQEAFEAANNKDNAFFVFEHRTHIKSLSYKEVISFYLNSK